jgi:hypothetical protein
MGKHDVIHEGSPEELFSLFRLLRVKFFCIVEECMEKSEPTGHPDVTPSWAFFQRIGSNARNCWTGKPPKVTSWNRLEPHE